MYAYTEARRKRNVAADGRQMSLVAGWFGGVRSPERRRTGDNLESSHEVPTLRNRVPRILGLQADQPGGGADWRDQGEFRGVSGSFGGEFRGQATKPRNSRNAGCPVFPYHRSRIMGR